MRTTTSMRVSTGIPRVDEVLRGGFLQGRSYLVTGNPGSGKTTFGLQFLASGTANGDRPLFICVDEPEEHVRSDAEALRISTDGITFLDLTPEAAQFSELQIYDIFSPFEVEREPVAREIAAQIEETKARRIFVDGFGEFERLASEPLQFRRLVQSFFRFVANRHATVLLSSILGDPIRSLELESTVDGIIELGGSGTDRFLQVRKFRGSDFDAGRHPIRLTGTGIQVFAA